MINVTSAFTKSVQSRLDIIREEGNMNIDSQDLVMLIILRDERRVVKNLLQVGEQLISTLFNETSMRIEIYNGTDSANQTIEKFSRANIVLGMHGAGLVNTLFCRNDTLVIEFTFTNVENAAFVEQSQRVPWRTNRVVGDLHQGLHWITYLLQPDKKSLDHNRKKFKYFEFFDKHFNIPQADTALLIDGVLNHTLDKADSFRQGSWNSLGPASHSSLDLIKSRTRRRFDETKTVFVKQFQRKDAGRNVHHRVGNSPIIKSRSKHGVDLQAQAYAMRKRARKMAERDAKERKEQMRRQG